MSDDRVTSCALLLERAARDGGYFLTGDLRVCEADAALLLGYSGDYLRQMRAEGKAPVAYRAGLNGARVSYRLHDIAVWIEDRREA